MANIDEDVTAGGAALLGAAVSAAESDAVRVLGVVRKLNTISDAQALLDALAEEVAATAGYRVALISLTLSQGPMHGAWNLPPEAVELFRAEALVTPLERRVKSRERYRARAFPGTGIAYVRHDAGHPYGRHFRPTDHEVAGTWHPRDRLMILVRGPGGRDIGVLSLDDPIDGQAPREEALGPLRQVEQILEIGGNFLHARLFESELRQSEERYRRLVDNSPDGVLVLEGGRILFANRALAAMLGEDDPWALVGLAPLDIVHPDERPAIAQRMAQALAGSPLPVRHTRLVAKGGRVVDVESVGISIEYAGRPAVQVLLRDIGERMRLEEQVREAQKMEAVGRLAGGVAHEFNNLFAVIAGYGQLVHARCDDDPVAAGGLMRILAASDRAAMLTRQLLAFARREFARPALVDPNDVARNARLVATRLAGPDVEVAARLAPAPGPVRADPLLLGQVATNLLVNAFDAMPRGGRILLETRDVAAGAPELGDVRVPPGACVVISVTDTGCGMDEETRARVFEPFFTTKGVGEGTGLGLATAYGIVAQSGGDLVCRSRPGEGTTFSIYLPRAEEAPQAPPV